MTRFHSIFQSLIVFAGAVAVQAQDVETVEASLDSLLQIPITAASKQWQTIEEAPASVTIITSSQIERFGYRTIEDVFKSVRGFYISNDRNYTYLGVRGFSRPTDYNNRVLLLINGHTTNENVYGSSAFGTDLGLPMDVIDRIEIVRGPGSALYGTNAMFAVVNIVTKKGIALDGFAASAVAGSHSLYEGSLLWGKEYNNGLDVFFSSHISDSRGEDLYFPEFDTESPNNGIAQNLDWDKYWSLFTTMSYGDFKLQALTTSREKAYPTAAWETAFNDPNASTLDEHQFIELQWTYVPQHSSEFTVRGYFDRYYYEGIYPYDDLQYDASLGQWIGTELRFRLDTSPNNRMVVGAEYQRHLTADYLLEYQGEKLFYKDFPYSIASLYMQNEFQPTEYLSLVAGLRYDSYSTFGGTVNPRGAIIYNPAFGSTLKLLYGTAFRAPNTYEIYFEDPIYGLKENTGLKPETIRTTELVWEQRITEGLFSIVSLYDYRMSKLIDVAIDPADSLQQFQNGGNVRARGIEFELNFKIQHSVHGYLSYALQSAENDQSTLSLTNSPQQLAKGGITYLLFKQIEASAELMYESSRKTVYDTNTDSYVLTNITVRSPILLEKFRCSITVRNVFDVQYRLPGGLEHVQDSILQPGRTIYVKTEVRL